MIRLIADKALRAAELAAAGNLFVWIAKDLSTAAAATKTFARITIGLLNVKNAT